jgi:aminoglycoside phosphotransferase (APT) family kinase protein
MIGKELGVGRTATVYEYHEDQVIKLYNETISDEFIKKELRINQLINELIDVAPTAFHIVDIEGKKGIVFEKVVGKDLVTKLKRQPNQATFFAKEFADPQVEFHRIEVNGLNKQKDEFTYRVIKSGLEQDKIDFLLNLINTLEDDNKICHGDYHPGNFIYGKRKRVLDWTNAYQGHPVGDVLKTMLLINTPYGNTHLKWYQKPIRSIVVKLFSRVYMNYYLERNQLKINSLNSWEAVIYASRLCEGVPGEEEWLKKEVNKRINILKEGS